MKHICAVQGIYDNVESTAARYNRGGSFRKLQRQMLLLIDTIRFQRVAPTGHAAFGVRFSDDIKGPAGADIAPHRPDHGITAVRGKVVTASTSVCILLWWTSYHA